VPAGHFKGQFELNLPSLGRRWPDFAIETPEGKRIVVELDGHGSHVALSHEKFNERLLRQNAITCAGWTVLRFSFMQLATNAAQCRELLRAATLMPPTFASCLPLLIHTKKISMNSGHLAPHYSP
jgi:very-short-patch-repair endonuclease